MAVPGTDPTAHLACCARISLMKRYAGIDVQELYPGAPHCSLARRRLDYDGFLKAAEACAKAGYPFGIGISSTPDSRDSIGAIFNAFGAELVNARGEITVNSDNVRRVLENGQKLVKFLPADA